MLDHHLDCLFVLHAACSSQLWPFISIKFCVTDDGKPIENLIKSFCNVIDVGMMTLQMTWSECGQTWNDQTWRQGDKVRYFMKCCTMGIAHQWADCPDMYVMQAATKLLSCHDFMIPDATVTPDHQVIKEILKMPVCGI